MIRGIHFRSSLAEGNPMHKSFTREDYPSDAAVGLCCPLGLEGSSDWCRDKQVRMRDSVANPDDRAILMQSVQNVELLVLQFPQLADMLRRRCSFGQNLTVDGDSFCAAQMCVGDVYEIVSSAGEGSVTGCLQVTSPRWPCYKIDHNLARSLDPQMRKCGDAVQGYSATRGLAGVFLKVLSGGFLKVGSQLRLKSRPCPKWTLERISRVFYGGPNRITCMLDEWQGTEDELQEVLKLKQLARFEWRDRLVKYVQKREERRIKEMEQLALMNQKIWQRNTYLMWVASILLGWFLSHLSNTM